MCAGAGSGAGAEADTEMDADADADADAGAEAQRELRVASGGVSASSGRAPAAARWRLSDLDFGSLGSDVTRLPPLPAGIAFGAEYDLVLLIDQREQFGREGGHSRLDANAEGVAALRALSVATESRTLGIGDFLWIARSRRSPKEEYCLDLIGERKRLDDLLGSIRDGRYNKQKYFLLNCGLQRRARA